MVDNPLGQQTAYPEHYSPGSLYPLPRAHQRELLGIASPLPFAGADLWRAYELSWLGPNGEPYCAMAEFSVPCQSECLVESKSLKLYLNSLNMTQFESETELVSTIENDVSAAAGGKVTVRLVRQVKIGLPQLMADASSLDTVLADALGRGMTTYRTDASLLRVDETNPIEETLYSDLFRSLCPVTSQPDWGSVFLRYSGYAIDHGALLEYIVSYRRHQGFHEDCVERMFRDIEEVCRPDWLVLGIQFLRRGGLEINPWRWSANAPIADIGQLVMRTERQ